MMNDRFSRAELMFGNENMEVLKKSRVAVFGVGGVGGYCAEALCRTGVGSIDLFDGDIIDITNINRQIIATDKTIGQDKVEAMRNRLLEINPEVKVKAYKIFYLPETADEVDLSVYDHIVDAVDTISAKLELACRSTALRVPVISSMGAANKLDPTAFMVADIFDTSVCPVARIMRRELKKRGVGALQVVYSKEPPVKPIKNPQLNPTRNDPSITTTDLLPGIKVIKDQNHEYSIPDIAADIIPDVAGCHRRISASNAFVPPVAGLIMAAEVVKSLTLHTVQWVPKRMIF